MSSFVQGLVQKVVASVRLGGGLAPDFPYDTDRLLVGAAETGGPWSVYAGHAVRKTNGGEEQVTIFIHELPSPHITLAAVRNAIKRLKTMRHPCILRFIGSAETERQVMFATERVEPLANLMADSPQTAGLIIPWAIHRLQRAMEFIHVQARMIHGNLRMSSLFSTTAGELKLGGFELASDLKDDALLIFEHDKIFARADTRHWPPEVHTVAGATALSKVRSQPLPAIDSYMMARLLVEIYPKSSTLPPEIASFVRGACNQDARHRAAISSLSTAQAFFKQAPVVELDGGLDEIHGMVPEAREHLLGKILAAVDALPPAFLIHKVAVALHSMMLQTNDGCSATSIRLFLACARLMDEEQFGRTATPVIQFLFQKPDRGIRMVLLGMLPSMVERLPEGVIQDKVYPSFVSGFTDAVPALRDLTLKTSILLAPKLTSRQLNTELLRFYARLQLDEQSGIRVNTLICLSKIANLLDPATCRKVLAPALVNSIRDPFVPSKMAALSAIKTCKDLLGPEDVAKALLPAITPLMVEPEQDLRSAAFATVDWLLEGLKRHGIASLGGPSSSTNSKPSGRPHPPSKQSPLPATAHPGASEPAIPSSHERDPDARTSPSRSDLPAQNPVVNPARQPSTLRKPSIAPLVRSIHRIDPPTIDTSRIAAASVPLDGWDEASDLDLDSPTGTIERPVESPPPAPAVAFSPPSITMEDPWN